MGKDLINFKEPTEIVIPENWDYDKSVQHHKNLFKAVREGGEEAVLGLGIVHKILTEDYNKNRVNRKYPDKTFGTYCDDIEIGRKTGYRWIEKYLPVYYLSVKQNTIVSSDTMPLPPGIEIWQGDFNEKSKDIPDNSIDLVLTDPPYPEEYLPLWQDLFRVANRVLKPSGFLVAYSGQIHLDKIFKMPNDLIYYWMMNIEFTKSPMIMGRKIYACWKPILIFQKSPFKMVENAIRDKIKFDYTERELHDKNWGQTLKPFELLVESFSKMNEKVLDPFAGTGTTLIACKNKNRSCIGIEKEEKYINLIKGRLYGK